MQEGDIITCSNMIEAVELQYELAEKGFETTAYQTISNEVIVKVGKEEKDNDTESMQRMF